jgi:hypothetical protein
MDTFATPGTPISRGRIFHRARTDIATGDTIRDDSPITATRLADASGWIMIGGLPTFGRGVRLSHPFLDHLPGGVKVRSRLERQVDADRPRRGCEWMRSS